MNHFITIWAAGKPIGCVSDSIFYKKVRSSKHFLRHPPAICIDVQSLRDAEDAGAQWVQIEDADTGKVYRAHVNTIRKRGKRLNRGFGAQYALSLGKWDVSDPANPYQQLSLLGVLR